MCSSSDSAPQINSILTHIFMQKNIIFGLCVELRNLALLMSCETYFLIEK